MKRLKRRTPHIVAFIDPNGRRRTQRHNSKAVANEARKVAAANFEAVEKARKTGKRRGKK